MSEVVRQPDQVLHRPVGHSRIVRISTFIVDVPLAFKRSNSKGALSQERNDPRHGNPVLVAIEDNRGRAGYGQIRPTNYGETTEGMASAIHRYYAPALIGADPLALDLLFDRLNKQLINNPNALATVDMALHDLAGKILDIPLYSLLGGEPAEVRPLWSVSLGTIDDMVEESRRAVSDYGVRMLSLKVGPARNWRTDIDKIIAIRAAVGNDIQIGIDANEGYDFATARQMLSALERESGMVAYFEQPLKRHNLKELAALRRTGVSVLLDESVASIADAHRAVLADAADCFVIKIAKAGGITGCRRLVGIARAAAIDHTFGGNSQANLLEAACYTHLAASFPPSEKYAPEFILGLGVTDQDPFCEPVNGMTLEAGGVLTPSAPGIGIEINMKEVKRRSVESLSIQ